MNRAHEIAAAALLTGTIRAIILGAQRQLLAHSRTNETAMHPANILVELARVVVETLPAYEPGTARGAADRLMPIVERTIGDYIAADPQNRGVIPAPTPRRLMERSHTPVSQAMRETLAAINVPLERADGIDVREIVNDSRVIRAVEAAWVMRTQVDGLLWAAEVLDAALDQRTSEPAIIGKHTTFGRGPLTIAVAQLLSEGE